MAMSKCLNILVCNKECYCKFMWASKSNAQIRDIPTAVDIPSVLTPVQLQQFSIPQFLHLTGYHIVHSQ